MGLPSLFHINSYYITSALHKELASKLDERSIQQLIYVPVASKTDTNINLPENWKSSEVVYRHCFGKFDRYIWPLKMTKIWHNLQDVFVPGSFGLIHAHSLITNGLIAHRAGKKWGTPYIVTVRETDVHVFMDKIPGFKHIARQVLNNASAIITLSPAYKDVQLRRALPGSFYQEIKEKISVVSNGIHPYWLDNRFESTPPKKKLVILFVGQMIHRKNFPGLIAACRLMKGHGYKISIEVVGSGPLFEPNKQKSGGLDVVFHGKISNKQELLEVFRKSHVLVVPSFKESFGLVYPEAMSQGLPVIYTKDQGFDGFFPDGHVGHAVNPNDPEEIADRITRIYDDYTRYSSNAYAEAPAFSWDKVADKLIAVYRSCMKD